MAYRDNANPIPPPVDMLREAVDDELDERIILVPASEWPPADPDPNVLYLKGE